MGLENESFGDSWWAKIWMPDACFSLGWQPHLLMHTRVEHKSRDISFKMAFLVLTLKTFIHIITLVFVKGAESLA